MLSTELSTFFLFLALFLAGFALSLSVTAVRRAKNCAEYANSCADWMQNHNTEVWSGSQIEKIVLELSDLDERHASLLASHKRLRSRVGMRELRERRKSDSEPSEDQNDMFDPMNASDGEKSAYKARLREDAKRRGLLK